MKHIVFSFLLFFFFVNNCISQEDIDVTWPHYINAYVWEKWTNDVKFGYVVALLHGYLLGNREVIQIIQDDKLLKEEKISQILSKTKGSVTYCCMMVRYGQMIEGIDEFYKDYANKDIPVFMLMPLACKRVKGEISQEAIENELQKLRQEAQKFKR